MRLVRYHTDQGQFIALVVTEGPKWLHVILMDAAGIALRRVKASEAKWMDDLSYPLDKAVRKFRKAGRAFGITKAARRALA